MKYLTLIILFSCLNLKSQDKLLSPPERPPVKLSMVYNGKTIKDYKCKVILLDEVTRKATIVTDTGKVVIVEILQSSIPAAKESIIVYAAAIKAVEEENKTIAARNAQRLKNEELAKKEELVKKEELAKKEEKGVNEEIAKTVELNPDGSEYRALDLNFKQCLKHFGRPKGKIQSIKDHVESGYSPINFFHRGWQVEVILIDDKCVWARYNKESSHPSKHFKIEFKDAQLLSAANIPKGFLGPKDTESLYLGKSSKHWTNEENTASMFFSKAAFCDPHLLFTTDVWEKKQAEILKKRREKSQKFNFKKMAAKAKEGDLISQYNVATYYLRGYGVTKNTEKGLEMMTFIADKGYVNAQFFLGNAYDRGRSGIQKDRLKAITWYQKAVKSGHRSAQQFLDRIK